MHSGRQQEQWVRSCACMRTGRGCLPVCAAAPEPPRLPAPPRPGQVQDQANTGVRGWMAAAGAFDRGDLLYLRGEEERRRFAEQEQQVNERQEVRRTAVGCAGHRQAGGGATSRALPEAGYVPGWQPCQPHTALSASHSAATCQHPARILRACLPPPAHLSTSASPSSAAGGVGGRAGDVRRSPPPTACLLYSPLTRLPRLPPALLPAVPRPAGKDGGGGGGGTRRGGHSRSHGSGKGAAAGAGQVRARRPGRLALQAVVIRLPTGALCLPACLPSCLSTTFVPVPSLAG